jgi:hypothetical protein
MTDVKASMGEVKEDTLTLGKGEAAYALIGQGFTCADVSE